MTWLGTLTLLGVVAISCVMAAPCPCGETFERDPFGSEEGFFVGPTHQETAHCFCRCGADPHDRLPPSATCEGYEAPCKTRDGELARYECE